MGNIIDGKQLSLRLKGEMAEEVKALAEKYGRVPLLAVILVGENPASQSYVRGKIKAAEEVAKIECDNLFHRTDIGHKAFK